MSLLHGSIRSSEKLWDAELHTEESLMELDELRIKRVPLSEKIHLIVDPVPGMPLYLADLLQRQLDTAGSSTQHHAD